jgi:hypothetical protein
MRAALALLPVLAACHDRMPRSEASAVRDDVIEPLAIAVAPAAPAPPCPTAATRLGEGLSHERQPLGADAATSGDPCFDIVRADPARFRLRLLTKAQDGLSAPAPQWRERFKLAVVTNAGMFHSEGAPVGLLVEDGTALSKDNKRYGGYLAFDPVSPDDAPALIAGRGCPGFDLAALRTRYRSILQSNRLLGCTGDALTWMDAKQYSAAAVGIDRKGHYVFIHARAGVRMSELARALSGLDLASAMFLEGGPEASLVVRGDRGELARVGSYETGFIENDENQSFWWLPNVLALEAR